MQEQAERLFGGKNRVEAFFTAWYDMAKYRPGSFIDAAENAWTQFYNFVFAIINVIVSLGLLVLSPFLLAGAALLYDPYRSYKVVKKLEEKDWFNGDTE